MEDETQAAVAVADAGQDAPPVDADAVVAEQASAVGPDGLPALADDFSNAEEWLRASEAAINAAAAQGEQDAESAADPTATAASPEPAAVPSSAPEQAQAQPDFSKLIEDLQARGFKVEPPAPPPDPFEQLRQELAPFVGQERYEELKAVALKPVPAEPAAYDQATVEAHEALVREVNDAKAALAQMDEHRRVHATSYAWARQKVLADAGAELAGMADKYGADRGRVSQPRSVEDAVDAVAEAVAARKDAEWQAKYDAREKFWQGKVRQAQADASVSRHRDIATAPSPSVPGGAAPASAGRLLFELDPRTGLPTEAAIQRAIRGEFAHVDLSDR